MAMHTTRVDERDPHLVDRARSRRALGKHIAGAALGGALVRLGGGTAVGAASPAGVGRRREQLVHPSLQRIVVDDTELEYEERGAGEPVLLIHGGVLADAFAPAAGGAGAHRPLPRHQLPPARLRRQRAAGGGGQHRAAGGRRPGRPRPPRHRPGARGRPLLRRPDRAAAGPRRPRRGPLPRPAGAGAVRGAQRRAVHRHGLCAGSGALRDGGPGRGRRDGPARGGRRGGSGGVAAARCRVPSSWPRRMPTRSSRRSCRRCRRGVSARRRRGGSASPCSPCGAPTATRSRRCSARASLSCAGGCPRPRPWWSPPRPTACPS